jgi:hypothetical protein
MRRMSCERPLQRGEVSRALHLRVRDSQATVVGKSVIHIRPLVERLSRTSKFKARQSRNSPKLSKEVAL